MRAAVAGTLGVIVGMVVGCSGPVSQFADVAEARRNDQSLVVGELDQNCHITHIQVRQKGMAVATIAIEEGADGGRRFSAAVKPGEVELRARVDQIDLGVDSERRHELRVRGYFTARLDVPPDSVTYIGRIYTVAARQAELADYRPPLHSTGRPYRVWVQASDDWANSGGAEAYLRRHHPDCLDLFSTVQAAVRPTWQAE
ncbi:MAG TPA: hypothetical protein VMZ31_19920 [Phycisphaerae bacterium]|nr:hypothetical protein [Phycisphaerae bacterium]